ncbi:LysR substrate-binding domain-containing protein [Ningiella sp. W23]|uniref:LysR substrate-binding domain-containing protein n=1 Tax=Ningiella sp. W23 TaxID=3023715 RepID=UPI003757BB0E
MLKSRLPPLKSLHFFRIAAQKANFKEASESLNVTQAAVSQQIKLLEDFLGIALFTRNNQSTKLTLEGERLQPFIERGFTSFTEGVELVHGDTSPNTLKISAIHSFTSIWLMPRLPAFQAMHPNILVQINPSNNLVDFAKDDIDVCIRMGGGGYQGLSEKKLFNDHLVLVLSPTLLKDKVISTPANVFSLPYIQDPSPQTQAVFERVCNKFDVDPTSLAIPIRTDNSMLLIENALAGRGFTFVNQALVAEHLRDGTLITALGVSEPSPWALYLVAPPHHFSRSKVKLFEQWLCPQLDARRS